MKHNIRIWFCGFVLMFLFVGAAQARETVELSMNLITPPSHLRNENLIRPWIKMVEEKRGGTLKITPYDSASLAPVAQAYEAAVMGIADISEGLIYATPGVFPLTEMIMLPDLGLGNSSVAYCQSVWRAYATVPELRAEWKAVRVLWLHAAAPSAFMMREKSVRRIEDLSGLKLRVSGSISVRIAEALGFSPVSLSISDLYQAMEKRVIDGTMMNYEMLSSRRLGDVTKSMSRVPLVTDAFFVVMNLDSWNSLSPEHQAVLNSLSGDYAVELSGRAWDKNDRRAIEVYPQIEYISPDEKELQRFKEKLAPIKFEYVEALEKKGLPARRVLEILMGR